MCGGKTLTRGFNDLDLFPVGLGGPLRVGGPASRVERTSGAVVV